MAQTTNDTQHIKGGPHVVAVALSSACTVKGLSDAYLSFKTLDEVQ